MPSIHTRRSVLATTGIALTSGCMSIVNTSKNGDSALDRKLTPQWEIKIPGRAFRPTVYDDTVYVAGNKNTTVTNEGFIIAISLEDGAKEWREDNYPKIEFQPVIYEGIAYISTNDGKLIAFDLNSKTRLWTQTFSGSFTAAPHIHDEKLYVGTRPGQVLAIDPEKGAIIWQIRIPETNARITAVNKHAFITSNNEDSSYIRKFHIDSKKKDWEYRKETVPLTQVALAAGYAFSAAIHGQSGLLAMDNISGNSVSTEYVNPASDIPITSQGNVFLSHLSGVSAFDAKSREVRWQVIPPETRVESAPVVTDESVFVTTTGGSKNILAMLKLEDGTFEDRLSIPTEREPSRPTYHGGSIVYSTTEDMTESYINCARIR